MNDIVCLQKYKTIVSTSTVISGSAKGVTYLLLKIGFCFLPNLCSLMGRMKLVMYSRQVIEVAWFHMGWRKLSVEWVAMPFSRRSSRQGLKPHLLGLLLCQEGSLALEPPGKPQELLALLLFSWWSFWDGMWGLSCWGHLCWDAFSCLSFLRVGLWNAEGCPVPLSTALQTPSPCTLPASAARSADVSTDWGSGWPSVLRDWFIPPFFRPPTEQHWWNINTSNWLLVMCRHFTEAIFFFLILTSTLVTIISIFFVQGTGIDKD